MIVYCLLISSWRQVVMLWACLLLRYFDTLGVRTKIWRNGVKLRSRLWLVIETNHKDWIHWYVAIHWKSSVYDKESAPVKKNNNQSKKRLWIFVFFLYIEFYVANRHQIFISLMNDCKYATKGLTFHKISKFNHYSEHI